METTVLNKEWLIASEVELLNKHLKFINNH